MKNVRALVIAPQPFFTPRGTPFSVYYRTLVMSEMGIQVDLIAYGEGQDVDLPNVKVHRIPRFARLGTVKIGPSPLKLFLDFFIVLWTLRLLFQKKYDIVHAHEEAVFFCSFLKPVFGFKMIYDMHSSLPQQLTNFRFTTSKLIIGCFEILEEYALRTANAVITICPDLADYVDSVIQDKTKHVMIENSIFEPVKLLGGQTSECDSAVDDIYKALLSKYADNLKLIVYAGTLEAYQGIDILLKAFKMVIEEVPGSKLLIAGGSPTQVKDYTQMAEQLGIGDSVVLTGRVPQQVAQKFCSMAAVQVSPRSAGTNTPLKIYEQLASGIPLVATNIYSHTQAIDSEVAFLVEPIPEAMASGIIKAMVSGEDSKNVAEAAQIRYQEKYSRPVYERKMKTIMKVLGLCVGSAA